jgi:hypothetical protein
MPNTRDGRRLTHRPGPSPDEIFFNMGFEELPMTDFVPTQDPNQEIARWGVVTSAAFTGRYLPPSRSLIQ